MTRAEMLATMGNDEFVGWQIYYGRKAQREELALAEAKKG